MIAWTDLTTADYPTFQDAFDTLNPAMTIQELNIGGRLIPQSLVASNESAASLTSAINYIVENNGILAGVSFNPAIQPTFNNSVNPYWREIVFLAFFGM